jgi:hypothetical protein
MSHRAKPSTSPLFPGLYSHLLPLQTRASFQLLSARHVADGRRCVLVLPGPRADRLRVAQVLAEVEAIHARIDHPIVPKVAARGEVAGMPYLEFDCPASRDALDVIRCLAESGQKIPYEAADAFIVSLRLALEVAHRATHPVHGGPIHLGRLAHGNLLFADDGHWWLIGLGRNFPIENEAGQFDGTAVTFHAPEVATGGRPSAMGDYVAIVLFMRSLLPYAGLAPRLERLFGGEVHESDEDFLELLHWVEHRVLGQMPAQRATWQEAIDAASRIRAMMGTSIDQPGFVRFVRACIAAADHTARMGDLLAGEGDAPALSVDAELTWMAGPDGHKHKLGRAARRLMLALIDQHRRNPGEALTLWDLLERGWPGERPLPEAGANRVYVELNRLRKLGLRAILQRFDAGYRLAPEVQVRVVG